MTIHSHVLGRGNGTPGVYTTIYQAPANQVAIVKSVYLNNDNGSATRNVGLVLAKSDLSIYAYLLEAFPLGVGQSTSWSGWAVLEATDKLAVFALVDSIMYWASGAILGP